MSRSKTSRGGAKKKPATRAKSKAAGRRGGSPVAKAAPPEGGDPAFAPFSRDMALRVILIQLVGYVCMAVLWLIPTATGEPLSPSLWAAIEVMAMIVIVVFAYPFDVRTPSPWAARVAALAMGVDGIAFTVCSSGNSLEWLRWMVVSAGVLIIGAFLYELLRTNRSRMIYSLSTTLTAGFVALCGTGWTAMPILRSWESAYYLHSALEWGVLAFMIVMLILLGVVSVVWIRKTSMADFVRVDVKPEQIKPALSRVWIGWGLMPVLIYGAVIVISGWLVFIAFW